jgi:mono/diheme cytochrome c family protein
LYFGGSATQIDDKVVPGWDTGNNNAPPNRFYRDVFGRACRTCHIASPFGAPTFQTRVAFEAEIASVQDLVCRRRIMPHAQRTNDWFWNSLNPNMAAYLQLYGQTLPDWSNADNAQCGQFQGGGQAPSLFTAQIYPILQSNCVSCHSTNTLANFTVGNIANTYNSLFNDTKDGLAKYIVPNNPGSSRLYGRITTGGAGTRMPLGGPDLVASDTDNPADGVNDAPEVNSWIVGGAPGP